jgi:transcriptional regulator with XRE-family HTH domain
MESNELEILIEEIQFRKKLSLEEIAKRIGYSRPYLNKEKIKGNNPSMVKRLRKEFPEILQNVPSATMATKPPKDETDDYKDKYLKSLEQQLHFLKQQVQANLIEISGNVMAGRAENRAAIHYQVMKDSRGDEKKRVALMEQINRLIADQLSEAVRADNSLS